MFLVRISPGQKEPEYATRVAQNMALKRPNRLRPKHLLATGSNMLPKTDHKLDHQDFFQPKRVA